MFLMSRRTIFGISIALIGLLIALFHWLANAYYLYFLWWWADILMHFLGGLFWGLAALWWIRFEIPISIRHRIPKFLVAFVVVLGVGIAWEVFEKFFNIFGAGNYVLDTTLDLLMDIVGMLAAYLVFSRYGK